MLSGQECLDFCELGEDEIHAIAEHEHVPEIVAAGLGECLLQTPIGTWMIRRYMLADIEQAESRGQNAKAKWLHLVLERFDSQHPTYDLR
jgi:hypothetical protein